MFKETTIKSLQIRPGKGGKREWMSGCGTRERQRVETTIKDAIDGHHNALNAEIKGLSGKMTELQKTVENAVKSKKDDFHRKVLSPVGTTGGPGEH